MATMPHCDQAVLHAPGECEYCDKYPEWQKLRQMWGIAFTGHEPRDLGHGWREVPCPSDVRRPGGVNQVWPGNQPRPSAGGIMQEQVKYPGTVPNPWLARARKFGIAAAVALVEIANAYAGGPEWLYAAAAVVGAGLVYATPNAPRYKDPRPGR